MFLYILLSLYLPSSIHVLIHSSLFISFNVHFIILKQLLLALVLRSNWQNSHRFLLESSRPLNHSDLPSLIHVLIHSSLFLSFFSHLCSYLFFSFYIFLLLSCSYPFFSLYIFLLLFMFLSFLPLYIFFLPFMFLFILLSLNLPFLIYVLIHSSHFKPSFSHSCSYPFFSL